MWNFKKQKKKDPLPIPDRDSDWMLDAFRWVCLEYGEDLITDAPILLPDAEYLPKNLPITEDGIYELLSVVCYQMAIEYDTIELTIIQQPSKSVNEDSGYPIFLMADEETSQYAGLYRGASENGKFQIEISSDTFRSLDSSVAILAHELSHVILSGITKVKNLDEYLVELFIVCQGLGIFSANSAFEFHKGSESWGYSKQGYLNQAEWALALALYASIRNETNPSWVNYLVPGVKTEFIKSMKYVETLPQNWHRLKRTVD
jgi:hypothetical protein